MTGSVRAVKSLSPHARSGPHQLRAKGGKPTVLQPFGEQVRRIESRFDPMNLDELVLNELPDLQVVARDMLHPGCRLRVRDEVHCAAVVNV